MGKQKLSCGGMASWKHNLLLLILFLLELHSTVTSQTPVLYIYPKDPTFNIGSDVPLKCELTNGTHNQLVATNWTDNSAGKELQHGARERYVITDVKEGFHLIECQYNNLKDRTTLKVVSPDIRPVINCTSLSKTSYMCKWNIVSGVRYTYEYLTAGTWNLQIPQKHNGTMGIYVKVKENDNLQYIRVNATKKLSNASLNMIYDILGNLKPNITYIGSTMTATSAKLTWSTENKENGSSIGMPFQSEIKAIEECDDETSETCQRIELNRYHEKSSTTITIDDLKPDIFYKFYIRSRYNRTGNNFTEWTFKRERTHESRPSKKVKFESIENEGNNISLKWDVVPKESRNGKILGYRIYMNSESYADVDVNNTQYSLKEIGDDGWYNICITAFNSAGESPFNCQSVERNSTEPYEDVLAFDIGPQQHHDVLVFDIGPQQHHVQSSQNDPWNNLKNLVTYAVLIIIGIVIIAIAYSKLKNYNIFTTWPDPKFTEVNFKEVNFPVRENEVFDELRVRKTTVNISERRCNADIDIHHKQKDGYRKVQNHSYLKIPGTENSIPVPEDGLLDSPVVYHIAREKPDVQSVMCIDSSVSSEITRDKTAKNNGYFTMPPGLTPCSDGGIVSPDSGYLSPFLDHECIVPIPDNLALISDSKFNIPSLEHGSSPNSDRGYVASSSKQLGLDSLLKQGVLCSDRDPVASCLDHKFMDPRLEPKVGLCSDYLLITNKTAKFSVTPPTPDNNDYVTMTSHKLNVVE